VKFLKHLFTECQTITVLFVLDNPLCCINYKINITYHKHN